MKDLIVGIEFNHPNATDVNTILTYAQYAIYKMYICLTILKEKHIIAIQYGIFSKMNYYWISLQIS